MQKSFLILFLLVAVIDLVRCSPVEAFPKINYIDRYCGKCAWFSKLFFFSSSLTLFFFHAIEVAKCSQYQPTYGLSFMTKFDLVDLPPSGFIVQLSFFVKAPTTARIRLGVFEDATYSDYYDIGLCSYICVGHRSDSIIESFYLLWSVLGGDNNTKSWIEASNATEPLQMLQTPNIVTDSAPHKIKIEITEGNFFTHQRRSWYVIYILTETFLNWYSRWTFPCLHREIQHPVVRRATHQSIPCELYCFCRRWKYICRIFLRLWEWWRANAIDDGCTVDYDDKRC